MKKILLFILLITSGMAYGQKQIVWFDAGLKAQWGATALYNKALWDRNSAYDVGITTGYAYGGKIGINFGYNGVAIDLMFANGNQDFTEKSTSVSGTINWKSTDVYVLFRNARNLGYFEVGPKLSFLKKLEMNPNGGGESVDLTSFNEKTNIAAVLGFGANILGDDGRFSGILGLRFEYGFKNMTTADGYAQNNPIGNGFTSLYANGEENTNPIFAGVVFEFNWGIGYFGKAQCGARSKFIMF